MSIEALPHDLQQVITALAANEENAQKVMAGLSPAQLNWQPRGGKSWSILQCLEHLSLGHAKYLDGMWPILRTADPKKFPRRGDFSPGIFGRMFLAILEPPPRFKAPAPAPIQPASSGKPVEVLAAWLGSHASIREFARAAAPYNLADLTMRNPFVPLVSVSLGTALQILVTHDRRHVWQAAEVRKALDAAG